MTYEVREATMDDAEYIASNLRKEDIEEIKKMREADPREAVINSFNWSDVRGTLVLDGKPALIYGVVGSGTGVPKVWALGTDACRKAGKVMVKLGREVSDALANEYMIMENWCDADYVASLRWLRLIGFTVEEPENGFCHIFKGSQVCVF
jgi:hypothetical protein